MKYEIVVFKCKSHWFGAVFSEFGLYTLTFPYSTEQLATEQLAHEGFLWTTKVAKATILSEELERFYSGEKLNFSVPIDWNDYTDFQRRVLQFTAAIPHGAVLTYGAVARGIGNPKACRAVGQALHINRTPIVVPCHRVLALGNKLGGFGGGPAQKCALLELEGITFG